MKEKLIALWKETHPKTLQLWQIMGLSEDTINSLVTDEVSRVVKFTNNRLMRVHSMTSPEQVILD